MNPALAGRQFLTPISFLPAPTIALRASGVSRVTLSLNGWNVAATAIIFTQLYKKSVSNAANFLSIATDQGTYIPFQNTLIISH